MLTYISRALGLAVPTQFKCDIYVYRDKAEMMQYLDKSLHAHDVERWHQGDAALVYQLEDDGAFRTTLLHDDIPYLVTLILLEQLDARGAMPAALQQGMAHTMEKSVTNVLTECSTRLHRDGDGFWMGHQALFTADPDVSDDPTFLQRFEGAATAWAMFLRKEFTPKRLGRVLSRLMDGGETSAVLGKAFAGGYFDVMSRAEERVREWLAEEFKPRDDANDSKPFHHRKLTISVSFAVAVIALVLALLAWIKRLVA